MFWASITHRHLMVQMLTCYSHSASSLCAYRWTDIILRISILISAIAILHLPKKCLVKVLLLNMLLHIVATICLTSRFSISLRLLRSCVFSSRVGNGHVAHVDVYDNILSNEITNWDIVMRWSIIVPSSAATASNTCWNLVIWCRSLPSCHRTRILLPWSRWLNIYSLSISVVFLSILRLV